MPKFHIKSFCFDGFRLQCEISRNSKIFDCSNETDVNLLKKKKWKLFVVWQTWALPNRYCGCYSSANSKHELILCAIHRFHQMSKSSWFYILTHNRVMHKPCKNMSDTHSKKNNLHCFTRWWFKCAIIKCFRLLFDANFVPVPTE